MLYDSDFFQNRVTTFFRVKKLSYPSRTCTISKVVRIERLYRKMHHEKTDVVSSRGGIHDLSYVPRLQERHPNIKITRLYDIYNSTHDSGSGDREQICGQEEFLGSNLC